MYFFLISFERASPCQFRAEYDNVISPELRAAYERGAESERDCKSANYLLTRSKSHADVDAAGAASSEEAPVTVADGLVLGQPQSLALWYQTPACEPHDCANSAERDIAARYSRTSALSIHAYRSVLGGSCTASQFNALADEFRGHANCHPGNAAHFPANVVYPTQCGAFCPHSHDPPYRRLGLTFLLSLRRVMASVGGYKALLRMDLTLLVEVSVSDGTVIRLFALMPCGVGLPLATDLIRLEALTGDAPATNVGIHLSYQRNPHTQPVCGMPAALKSNVGAPICCTDDEMTAYVLRLSDDITTIRVSELSCTWVHVDLAITSGICISHFDPIVSTTAEPSKPPRNKHDRKPTHFMDAFDHDATDDADTGAGGTSLTTP